MFLLALRHEVLTTLGADNSEMWENGQNHGNSRKWLKSVEFSCQKVVHF